MLKIKITTLFLVILTGFASGNDFWQDSQVYTVGTMPHSCTHIPYPDFDSALKWTFDASIYYKSLNGNWAFDWVEKPADKPIDFHKVGFDDSSWKSIEVPSCWERKGYGHPYHGSLINRFRSEELVIPNVPINDNPVGSYRKSFTVPSNCYHQSQLYEKRLADRKSVV